MKTRRNVFLKNLFMFNLNGQKLLFKYQVLRISASALPWPLVRNFWEYVEGNVYKVVGTCFKFDFFDFYNENITITE